MDDVFVAQLMSSITYTVSPDTLVEDAAQTMLANDIGSVVVTDADNRVAGILTTTDFVRIVAESHPKAETAVSAYMTADVITTTAQTPVRDAADEMIEHGFHHLPVVDETEGLIGMITTSDLTAYVSHVQTPDPS
ncbi:CBS domain-containing protein [Halomarina halobia]|uniref:CBS domain-containing protein n=1 Tax=Halomarina halobia TaxID=3033386 RepID=A0ABD6A5E8_9EURY|nr:CBS domain-containing protein [Halomarina sp. PSR21]